ncbi:MAG TPA: hypothetical protein V6C81_00480 [Planktothrix sp.]|jgi:hypothetical protein
MNLEMLRITRNILLRTFVVGIGFVLLIAVATFGCWDSVIGTVTKLAHTDQATLTPILLEFFSTARFFLLFIVLSPALAIHWTLKKESAALRSLKENTPSGAPQSAYRL